jgi:hypothetical protein
VQIVHKRGRRVTANEHIGSAHTVAELALLSEIARQRLHEGQQTLEFLAMTPSETGAGGARVVDTRSQLLWQVLQDAYTRLGFSAVSDEAVVASVLARIIEPTSKADSMRVLAELGIAAPSLRTIFRALGRCIERDYRDAGHCLPGLLGEHGRGQGGVRALRLHDVVFRDRHRRSVAQGRDEQGASG